MILWDHRQMSSVTDRNIVMQRITIYGMSVTPNQAANGSCGHTDHYISHKQGNKLVFAVSSLELHVNYGYP